MTPLGMASDGLLDRGTSPALSIATRGYIAIAIVVVVTTPHYTTDGGGGSTQRRKDARKYDQAGRIRKDDNEVFEIIVIALRIIG